MKISTTKRMRTAAACVVVAVFGTSACDLLDVTNAGLIEDESLNNPAFAAALVAGMSADFSRAMNPGGSQRSPVMAFELTSGLSDRGEHVIGHLDPDIVDRQGTWDAWQRARWVASAGVTRLKESLGADYDRSPDAARANLWAGFSNRLLGESACYAVIDGGAAQPREVHFELAEAYFTEAARIAQAAGAQAQDTYLAALGGRASARAWQGNWNGAIADAALVPAEFVFLAHFATAGVQNAFFSEQFTNRYLTVMASPWEDVTDDPRVPWSKTAILEGGVAAPTRGGGYRTWPQMKFTTRDSDIPITHGAEMLVLRAEAALRAGNIAGMTSLLNESRALPKWNMAPLPQPASEAAAWELLKFERGATLWLEHRAFWDKARWYAEGRDNLLEGRAKCYPIGQKEIDSNPNLGEFR